MHTFKRRWQAEHAAEDAASAKTARGDAQPLPIPRPHIYVIAGFESFDVSPRMDKIATDVLPSLKHNEKMKAGSLRVGLNGMVARQASIQTGVVRINGLHVQPCLELAAYLRDPHNRSPEGYLLLAGKAFPGYDAYDRVHGQFNPNLQARQTVKFHTKADVKFALQHSRPLLEIFLILLRCLGVDLEHA